VEKGAPLGPSNEGERARQTGAAHPALTPAREVRVLKRPGVGEDESELGVDFSSFFMPSLG
jgi:hypothetical protein